MINKLYLALLIFVIVFIVLVFYPFFVIGISSLLPKSNVSNLLTPFTMTSEYPQATFIPSSSNSYQWRQITLTPSPITFIYESKEITLTPSPIPKINGTEPYSAATPSRPVTLRVYSAWPEGSVDDEGMGLLIRNFKKNNTNVDKIDILYDSDLAIGGIFTGKPPDVFFVNFGHEFFSKWVTNGYIVPLDDIYDHYGLMDVFPQGIIDLVSYDNHIWGLPLTISRSNVLYYNRLIFDKYDIKPGDIQSFSGWEDTAKKLQSQGIIPLAFGNINPWVSWQLFENVLVGTLGSEKYVGLWNGTTDWKGLEVKQALENLKMMMKYTNPDHNSLDWNEAYPLLMNQKAAMFIMGDWTVREFSSYQYYSYNWTTPPGTADTFIIWPDGFSLPSGTQNLEVAKEFLSYLGSKEGQESFNKNRGAGALCARVDCDFSNFYNYTQSSASDLRKWIIVPSAARAMAVSENWTNGFMDALIGYLSKKSVEDTQSNFEVACQMAKICR